MATARRLSRHRENPSDGFASAARRATPDGLIDLGDFVVKARDFGFVSLLVEGGERLATSFLREGLVDKYVVIVAPMLVGEGINSIGDLRIRRLRDAVRIERGSFETSGRDMIFSGYPERKR
jgi:diaminohydroxyphosphoribosylaminopyrimidine deaminase/5-amino-6-(5-phosphoribosylamino)uracil reductase